MRYYYSFYILIIYLSLIGCYKNSRENAQTGTDVIDFKFEDQSPSELEGHIQLDFIFNVRNQSFLLTDFQSHEGFKYLTFQQNDLLVTLFNENNLVESFSIPINQKDDNNFYFTILVNNAIKFDRLDLESSKFTNLNTSIHVNNIDPRAELFNQINFPANNKHLLVNNPIQDRKIIGEDYFLKFENNTNSIILLFPSKQTLDAFKITTLNGEVIYNENSFYQSDQFEINLPHFHKGYHIISFKTAYSTNLVSEKLLLN